MKAIKVLLFGLFAVSMVLSFNLYAAETNKQQSAEDDLLGGGEEKGKTFVPEESGDEAVGGVKEKTEKKSKDKTKESEDEDILKSQEVYHLPKVFAPIPHLLIIESEEVAQTPQPLMNITPQGIKKESEPKLEQQPTPKQEQSTAKASGLENLPAQQKEIPLDEALEETEKEPAKSEPVEKIETKQPRMIHVERLFVSPYEKSVYNVSFIDRDEMTKRNAMRTSDLLLEEASVFMNYRSPVANYPIIRGRNVRDTALYLGDVMVSSPAFFTMDIGVFTDLINIEYLDSVEILSGGNAVYLGSMASSGALYFNLRKSNVKLGEVHAEATLKFDTASSGADAYGRIDGSHGRISWTVAGGGGAHDDLYLGRNAGIERSTGYADYSGLLDVWFNLSSDAAARFFAYYSALDDVDLAPQVLLGLNIKDYMPTASLMALSLSYEHKNVMPFVERMKIAVGVSSIDYERNYVPSSTSDLVVRDQNKQLAMSVNADVALSYGITLGISYRHDLITQGSSEIADRMDDSVEPTTLPPQLPDGSTYDILSLFLADSYEFIEGLNIHAGVRYEYHSVKSDWQTPDRHGDKQDVSLDYTANIIDASGGVAYRLFDMITFLTNLSYTMRAPTLDQLAAYRWYDREDLIWLSSVKNGKFDMNPEKTLSPEVGIKVIMPSLEFKVFYYYSYIKDRILWTGNGTDTNIKDKAETTYFVGNSESAYHIQGVETEIKLKLSNYELRANYSFTTGEEDKYNSNAPLIPPHHGGVFARWTHPEKFAWVEGYLLWASVQDNLAPWEDVLVGENTWSIIPSDGTDAWFTLNARAGFNFGNHITMTAGVTNILDKTYTLYGSGMTMPGRSFNMRLSVSY